MPHKGHLGTSLGGSEQSPARRKRMEKRRKAEEANWASKAGPITVRYAPGFEPPQSSDTPASD